MSTTINLDWKAFRNFSIDHRREELGVVHGVRHWDRVADFGKQLYENGADLEVITAFAYLHDVERLNDGADLEHGKRASLLIDSLRDSYLKGFSESQTEKLKKACELHTIERRTGDLTIDICFDADRLDLPRVGITPNPKLMATSRGAKLAAEN